MPPDSFSHQVELDMDFEQAVERVTAELKKEGFGVLTEIDVKETLREKLEVEFRRYIILGACNPPLAHQALSSDLSVGLLLPCNAIVYEAEEGGSVAAFLDPDALFSLVDSPGLAEVASDATARIKRVAASLRG